MKKILALIILLTSVLLLGANQSIALPSQTDNVEIMNNSESGFDVNFTIGSIESFDVQTKAGDFSQLRISGFAYTNEIGSPKLPVLRKIISVPWGADVELTIENINTASYNLADYGITNPVIPAQPSLSKSQNPEDVEFVINSESYNTNSFRNNNPVTVEELGYLRGMRLFVLQFNPVDYNPVNGVINIHDNISLNVQFNNADYYMTDHKRAVTYSPYFEADYQRSIFNYHDINLRDEITEYPITYVIISDRMFQGQLQQFIDWKIMQGFTVIETYTDDIGSSTSAIQTYIADLYDNATVENPAPSFILFVGDTGQIPAWSGDQGGHITDLDYVKLEGNDYMPEIYYARFSAQNTSQLQPQIDKTLQYEKYEMPDPSYLGEVVMIAGMDSSHGSTWGNGQINYGTTNYFNEDHGIVSHTYLYPQSGSNSDNIINNVSEGVGYINYTAHGGSTEWCDPEFLISDINSLDNEGKYPLAVGNCCLTNKFEVSECFGEAWLRAENKGSIGYIGGTNSTYWDEDYYWGVGAGSIVSNPTYESTGRGTYDGLFHDHDESFADWFTTAASMMICGNLAVVEGNGSYNYYWEIYALMGDPSLSAYLGVPTENNVTLPDVILMGLNSIEIEADPYSLVGLSYDGQLKATTLVDESGTATLTFEPFATPGYADIVITAQNRQPVINEIQVIPNSGPYLLINDVDVLAGDDDYIEAGEDVQLSVILENVGSETATNVSVNVLCSDPHVTMTDDTETYNNVNANGTATVENGFAFSLANTCPDQHVIPFTVVITSDQDTWDTDFELIGYEANVFAVNPAEFDITVEEGEILYDVLSISNTSTRVVDYTIRTDEITTRDMTGSYVVCSTEDFTPGETVDWTFTAYNNSPDGEWCTDVNIIFPTGVTVNSATDMVGGSGAMLFDGTIGEGVTINFHGATAMGYGHLHDGQAATATINVTTTTEFAGNLLIGFEIVGDGYGNDPHIATGNIEISYPLSWISLASSAGSMAAGETDDIDITFDSSDLGIGIYNCEIFISDGESRDYKIVPVTLTVDPLTDSDDDEIPTGTFLAGNYPNPFNPTTTIAFSIDSNISAAELDIYNSRGQKIKTFNIKTESHLTQYSVTWDGTDINNNSVGSGIYFAKLKAGDYTSTKKMILMK